MKRSIQSQCLDDLEKKIVLLSGPRQSGKTTLAKQLISNFDYLDYDFAEDRLQIQEMTWNREADLVIFDELHKKSEWKRWLKGIYDTSGIPPKLLVTGSAKMETYQKVGDSLAGRYFQHRLYPLDVREAVANTGLSAEEVFQRLWHCSGFPEPFLSGEEVFYKRWRRSHLQIILEQDLVDLYTISDVKAIETLVLLLKKRVGSTVSYANLARDLERDPSTVKRWLQLLENLYIIFKVPPFHNNVARSLLKEPKYYFYDCTYAESEGARLENIAACCLLKACHELEDQVGVKSDLYYVRTKDGKELDFLTVLDDKPSHLIEIKQSDEKPSLSFRHFEKYFPGVKKLQLVKQCKRVKSYPDGVSIHPLVEWFKSLDLQK